MSPPGHTMSLEDGLSSNRQIITNGNVSANRFSAVSPCANLSSVMVYEVADCDGNGLLAGLLNPRTPGRL
jgi:hypothetical protein